MVNSESKLDRAVMEGIKKLLELSRDPSNEHKGRRSHDDRGAGGEVA